MSDIALTVGAVSDARLTSAIQAVLRTFNDMRGVASPNAMPLAIVASASDGSFLDHGRSSIAA